MNSSVFENKKIPNEFITEENGVSIFLKREDLLHPEVSGNKFRKLKYNFGEAIRQNKKKILTFGGAFSNHIAATAAAGKLFGLKTIGIIRGEELGSDLQKTLIENPTLNYAANCGMEFEFISRALYRKKEDPDYTDSLRKKYGNFYLLPEGGTNPLAIKGCSEILTPEDEGFDIICCPVGTGGTMAGIVNSSFSHQRVLGFSALKGKFLHKVITELTKKNNWKIIIDYHFNGYAKVNRELVEFINDFKEDYQIALDPVYTGKMIFGIFDLVRKNAFPAGSRILAVHTGGLQGIPGMNNYLKRKCLPQIKI
ncbi:MAG TPA: pyridoxal-phosphate dependent enzyme [Salinimicrobium sp.]|nr:pyridoxal-phosphate dependent enzyme [Salinimicrobium sp.]